MIKGFRIKSISFGEEEWNSEDTEEEEDVERYKSVDEDADFFGVDVEDD